MELENHTLLNNNHNIGNISNQEVYAQEDLSFEADQENLNTSTSSDRFQTPSAKFIYDQISSRKQPSQNVRQILFQNLDPLNESNSQNTYSKQNSSFQNKPFNDSLESTICIEKSLMSKPINLDNALTNNMSSDNTNDYAMDLSSNNLNADKIKFYEDNLNEKDEKIIKLKNTIEQLNNLNQNLTDSILTVQNHFETNLNESKKIIQDLTLENSVIAKEKKLAIEDVQGLESSFAELHRRYEKLKLTLESCKKKEDFFQEECLTLSEKLQESQRLNNEYKQRLEILENEQSNLVENVKKQSEKELFSLKAQLKKAEMRMGSFQSQLEQKTKENQELNKMIDELTK